MKAIFLVVLVIAGIIYYDYWEDINNKDSSSWKQLTLYSIRLEGDEWKKLDIRLPPEKNGRLDVIEYKIAIPYRYYLERELYIIDIEVNPTAHIGSTSLQIVTTRQSDGQILSVETSWGGRCGLVGNITKAGSWDSDLDKLQSMGYPYFTNPKSVGFLWYNGMKYCKEGSSETIEHASSFPIIMKIYDGLDLIGEEQIDFEIFENGIMKYILMP